MDEVIQEDGDSENSYLLPLSERASAAVERPTHSKMINDTMVSTASLEFDQAFMATQMAMETTIQGDAKNTHMKNTYATLGNLLLNIKNHMAKNGLSLRQYAGTLQGHKATTTGHFYVLPIITKITHVETGQYEIIAMPIPIADGKGNISAHALGSAMTYGKRYALMSYWGIATLDDDAAQSVIGRIEEAEASEFADGIIEKMQICKTKPELEEWAKKNSAAIKLLGEKTSRRIYEAYNEIKDQLPEKLEEEINQDVKSKKKEEVA